MRTKLLFVNLHILFFVSLLIFIIFTQNLNGKGHYRRGEESTGTKKSSTTTKLLGKSGSHETELFVDQDADDTDDYGSDEFSPSKNFRFGKRDFGGGRGYVSGSREKVDQDDFDSIEEANEERIEEIVGENDKNLMILFYDKDVKCGDCRSALEKLEEIDDDLEATGYIEVVKSRNRRLAREYGVVSLPSVVYFRRKHPIIYDGHFETSDEIYRWIRSHEQVITEDLDDSNFEDKTDSYSPEPNAMDWFVLFYDSHKIDCNSFLPPWETAAHHLKGLVNIGKVDMHESDDVAQRFKVDDDEECPTLILFRKGKMYKCKDATRDSKMFVNFALYKYKESRGRRVPEPPTLIQELYEQFKEYLAGKLSEHLSSIVKFSLLSLIICSIAAAIYYFKFYKKRQPSDQSSDLGIGDKHKDL
uniref:Thioredoxin domain-containing protein n=1 Tax=Romanomermis culicivorax TaxID=13658 RepID=A0A915HFV6_ROMCU